MVPYDDHCGADKPQHQAESEGGRILNSVNPGAWICITSISFANEKPFTLRECHEEGSEKENPVAGSEKRLCR
jgi:hypothetical protein